MSHLRKSDQETMEHNAGLDHAIGSEGERAICAACGEEIINTGLGFWDHVGVNKPHHIATPAPERKPLPAALLDIAASTSERRRKPLPAGGGVWVGDAPEDRAAAPRKHDAWAPLRDEMENIRRERLDDLAGDSGIVLPYHPAPEDEPDEPLSTWLEAQLNLRAGTSPRSAADQLRAFYTAEWIADLLVCLCSRTAHTEVSDAP